ncbi:MAG TPA: DUF2868 domain-containing protein [Gammaproteobacteria bacterium]|nr:DUF2868 domain-containing protein [Gammaproteobacteria bacterium]
MAHSSLLADLVELNEVLNADSDIDLEQRKQRDRAIGLDLQRHRNRPAAQVRAWLRQYRATAAQESGLRSARLYHLLCLVLVVAGLLAGWGLTRTVLSYDGRQPINIVNAVVVLVLPQILLLLLWLLAMLPARLPLFGRMGVTPGFLNPGRLAGHLATVFSAKGHRGLSQLWDPDQAAILAPAARWLFSFWSQLFAFSFNVGALAAAFFLVTFSDLAFVWSTTLSISNEAFHQLLVSLSVPWSSLVPDAVPGLDLVTSSRYYRLDEGSLAGSAALSPQQAVELGQWWPFLIAAITTYGLLPRLLTLAVSWYRLRFHLRKALCNLPGAPELLARMNSPLITTLAAEPEQVPEPATDDAVRKPGRTHYALRCPVIHWSGVCSNPDEISRQLEAMGIEALDFLRAGGRQTTAQDHELVASLCKQKPQGIGILVKSWEPPLLDLLDFVRAVRRQCGAKMPVIVLLWGGEDTVRAADLETWQATLAQLGDPDLHVEAVGQTT